MSLSPKDDPRTWLLPGPREVPVPPFHARLLHYDLTNSERALCSTFDELCSKGARLCAAMETYALLSRLSVRTVYDLIHGRDRNGRHKAGFLDRGILTVDTPAKPPRSGHRYATPAIYVFHEAAIQLDPKALARQDARRQQPTLPGIPRPAMRGEPFDTGDQDRHPAPVADDTRHQVQTTPGTSCQRHPAPVAGDSKAFDSKAVIQRGEGEGSVSSSPSDDDVALARVLRAFEQSPITTGKATPADRATARKFLSGFTLEQIEYGILLAGARKRTSGGGKVQSLAYFANAIEEAAADTNHHSAAYAQYLRHALTRKPTRAERVQQTREVLLESLRRARGFGEPD